MSKTETETVTIVIPMDKKSKEKILKIAAKKAERSHSNPTAVIRDKLFSGFGIEPKVKPRNYTRKSAE